MDELNLDNFIEEVYEKEDNYVTVVHLYQPHVEACVRLNYALMNLAEQFWWVRFCRVIATEVLPDYDEIGLPTLLIFKAGKQLHNLVRATDGLGPQFSDRQVAERLNSLNVLAQPVVSVQPPREPPRSNQGFRIRSAAPDEDDD
eukprot:TRINITY_DN6833_c0_g2_i1.p1 TRINITY_DN6833_c0_g2~~TRINITY_DN6833_c0_g2_i1.p1  ORF type:complete len:164 (+),score=53.35 TRINITY_DN6833_c0_g2_i1:62-493(+)